MTTIDSGAQTYVSIDDLSVALSDGVWTGTDAGQFDDSQSLKWSRHALPPSIRVGPLTADIAYLYNHVGPA